jgi:xylan 1,4-beta-xylosidase
MLKNTFAAAIALALLAVAHAAPATRAAPAPSTWTPDNGNGTYTNPIFYDEFSDPDLIRVGDWFYLTGTTMHSMPGLPILRSKDLVNWEFLTYAADRLDFGPAYRLEDGKDIYGQGIWAPSLRYHNGTFYIFTNVNGRGTQVYSATDPRGPWKHHEMKRGLHDLSVLFDDDGRTWVVWGHQDMRLAQLNDDLTDIVPGTEKVLFAKDAGMGEGAHFYKINGKYYIISANYMGGFRMPAARADHVDGPYEVNQTISQNEDFGALPANTFGGDRQHFTIYPAHPTAKHRATLHQGGVVLTQAGEWWGFSMMDANSVGRLLGLSPVTWKDGWPWFGLPGNLTRTPRTWVKPKTAVPQPVRVPFERSDDFSGTTLKPIWEWNHAPVDGKWSLAERPGFLRLHTLPATSFWDARNTLTQRAIGPQSTPTVSLDVAGLQMGDVAGLGLQNLPYAALGVERTADGLHLALVDQGRGTTVRVPLDLPLDQHGGAAQRVWLRADCNFLTEQARFSYSTDGSHFVPVGEPFTMVYQTITFQGIRYGLFGYNTTQREGGWVDVDAVDVAQPYPRGLMRPIPYGRAVQFTAFGRDDGLHGDSAGLGRGVPTSFKVRDMGLGRAALGVGSRWLSVDDTGKVDLRAGRPGAAQSFQWIETPTGELVLLSLVTHRYLRIDPATGTITADSPGPVPDGSDGVRLVWRTAAN